MTDVLLEMDGRGRVSLGKLSDARRFLARAEPDGSILLTPAVVMSAHEVALLANHGLVETIRDARAGRSRIVRRELPNLE